MPVSIMATVQVRPVADVMEGKKVVAMPNGGLTCQMRGRRRRGGIDMVGAVWLTTTAKGELGQIRMVGFIPLPIAEHDDEWLDSATIW
jgi:hypothetical protein